MKAYRSPFFKSLIIAGLAVLALSGCNRVIVPPAHLGKEIGTSGYSPEVLPPGRHTIGWNSQIVILETGTSTKSEAMSVIMQDKLTLKFDVKFRTRIKNNQAILNAMFNDISPTVTNGERRVTSHLVYTTYGQMIVRNVSRAVLSPYTVEDVHKNYARISGELYEAIGKAFEGLPLEVSDVAIGNIEYPEVITAAVELAKDRELSIESEKAQAEIDMTKMNNARLLAEAQREIDMIKAQSIADQNKIIGSGVTPELLRYRELEVMEVAAKSNSTMWLPYSAFQNPSAQVGMFLPPKKD